MTLYAFVAPFRKPEPGTVMRVCQALLLPPHQRAGHGRRMLHAVHDYFSRDDVDAIADVVEINVEDPAPGFTSLRNCVDYERFLQLRDINIDKTKWWCNLEGDGDITTISADEFFASLGESQANRVASALKIAAKQVHLVYEMDRLHQLEEYKKKAAATNEKTEFIKELDKKYRLMVKKRLNKVHREEMGTCRTKKEMQDLLTKLFDESLEQYRRVLASVKRSSS